MTYFHSDAVRSSKLSESKLSESKLSDLFTIVALILKKNPSMLVFTLDGIYLAINESVISIEGRGKYFSSEITFPLIVFNTLEN